MIISGHLTRAELMQLARGQDTVKLAPEARRRVAAAHEVVLRAAAEGRPVYGVTTGLGSRVIEGVDHGDGGRYSLRTLRGRATAVGEPLPAEVVRATMAVRLNGLCRGGAGASLPVVEGLAALLNAGVEPVIPASGSVGASDLCLLAHLGLVLVGEGEAVLGGRRMPAADALRAAGLSPVSLETKDGLALCSSSAVSTAIAALALEDAEALLAAAQASAALSMEALRASLTPLDPRVVAARPAPGQAWAAAGLRALLEGSDLEAPGSSGRLQDPLSFRCASQIHGALHVALEALAVAVQAELTGAADNPLVLAGDDEILSTGNFHLPALALALDAAAIAVAQAAAPIAQRPARLGSERLSGLPSNLVASDPTLSGVSPLNKTAQALVLEIRHLAAPVAIHAAVGADGIEDDSTGATQGALRLRSSLERFRHLVAIELLVAAQALELRPGKQLGAGTDSVYRRVRQLVVPLGEDRPLGPDVERVAADLRWGGRLARIGEPRNEPALR